MLQLSLPDLSLAYIVAAGTVGSLILLAKRNQKQGWRKQRISWNQPQILAAQRAFATSVNRPPARPLTPVMSDVSLQHLGDLSRLREALTANGEPTSPAASPIPSPTPSKEVKANVLA
jgi:hypothetical protein